MTRLIGLLAAALLVVGVGISFPGPATSSRAPARSPAGVPAGSPAGAPTGIAVLERGGVHGA